MPLQNLKIVGDGMVALWRITENEEMLSNLAGEAACPKEVVHVTKRLEWLAGRVTIKQLTENMGFSYRGIEKDQFGKPFLTALSYPISLSHSYPYVAAQINTRHPVGIDVEQPHPKLLTIAQRVLNEEELQDAGRNPVKHCIYWCAKEALYKIYGRRSLIFARHLAVAPFRLHAEGALTGYIRSNEISEEISLHYVVESDFVLVYSTSV